MRNRISFRGLIILSVSWIFAGCGKLPDATLLREAEIIFVGEIVEMGPPPAGYSGVYAFHQVVTYKLARVLKGTELQSNIRVAYPILGNQKHEEKGRPGLSRDYFRLGRQFIVFANRESSGNDLRSIYLLPHSNFIERRIKSRLDRLAAIKV